MSKYYNSFEEIDLRLNILKIQRKITVESLKLKVNKSKENLKPLHLVGNLHSNLKHVLLTFALKKMNSIFGRKTQY